MKKKKGGNRNMDMKNPERQHSGRKNLGRPKTTGASKATHFSGGKRQRKLKRFNPKKKW